MAGIWNVFGFVDVFSVVTITSVIGGLMIPTITTFAALHARQDRIDSTRTSAQAHEQTAGIYKEVALGSLLQSAVRDAYHREFGETLPTPSIFNDERSVDCDHNGHLTTTAYLNRLGNSSTLLQMYLSRDGTRVTKRDMSDVVTPVGTFKTLVVILGYDATVNRVGLELFEAAQKQINEDHAVFARTRGYRAPLLSFDNTNIVIAPHEIDDPRRPASVRASAASRGLSPSDYQFVIVIDLNPVRFAGGLATPNGDVYVGNFGRWSATLDSAQWIQVARTAYHHEVAHHWGWAHDWSPTCGGTTLGFEPFLAAPVLFGWEDVDGDGVAEILDDTPYGRSR